MAQEDRNRLAEWFDALRVQIPTWRTQLGLWVDAVREQPALIWQTAVVRYSTYTIGALITFWAVSWMGEMIAPTPAGSAVQATSADFHVVCVNPNCGKHFAIHRKLGFHSFPVTCLTCGQETGGQARRCHSTTCSGRWVAPKRDDVGALCPHCDGRFE